MTTPELMRVLDDLAEFKCPVALFSGGEPLLHPDIVELARHAVGLGMRAVISTNGTLITPEMAERLATVGLSYIGTSLDGGPEIHDRFRGMKGSFDRAIQGLRNARAAGIKTGVRFTLTRLNIEEIPRVFDIMEQEGIPRICFYHLVYSGRGDLLRDETLSHEASRLAVDMIIDRTAQSHQKGSPIEVLTVDNHCDGPYLYMRLLRENPERAREVLELLRFNGGNSSGLGVAAISWDGAVHPDQFWRTRNLGNVPRRPSRAPARRPASATARMPAPPPPPSTSTTKRLPPSHPCPAGQCLSPTRNIVIGIVATLLAIGMGLAILNWVAGDLHRLSLAARRFGEASSTRLSASTASTRSAPLPAALKPCKSDS